MKLTVKTRSSSDYFYPKMRALIPDNVECIRCDDYRDWSGAIKILHDSIEQTEGMLLICDDDCFITNWKEVERLVRYCYGNEVLFCGVPDGGAIIPHRCFSWCTANPFFLILNCDLIKERRGNITSEAIDLFEYNPEIMDKYMPEIKGAYLHGHQECFNGFFYWLLTIGKPLYLGAEQMGDGISTMVKGLDGINIAYHTWYGRDAGEANVARINHIYSLAVKNKK